MDYLNATVPAAVVDVCEGDVGKLCDLLALPVERMEYMGRGFLGWLRRYDLDCPGAILAIGGQNGTAYVNLSAGALAYYERLGWDWQAWMMYVADMGVVFKRFDLALDDYVGVLTVERLLECERSGAIVRRSKGLPSVVGDYWAGGTGWTVNFGARSSDTFVRCYNKAAEQGVDGIWNRLELEIKGDRCDALVRQWISSGFDTGVLLGFLRSVWDVRTPKGGSRSRWRVARWWSEFMGACEKVRVVVAAAVRSPADVLRWLDYQVASSLALVVKAFGGEVVNELVAAGGRRIGRRQLAILAMG